MPQQRPSGESPHLFVINRSPESRRMIGRLREIAPGIISGAADLDPAAVLTATVAGASFGYSIGWVVLLTIPVLWAVFAVSARIGHETEKGLVQLIRQSRGLVAGWGMAIAMIAVNMTMIVADLVAVSDGFSLILQQPRYYFLPAVAFVVWWVLVLGDYRKSSRILIWFALFQLSYIVAAALTVSSPMALFKGILLPHFRADTPYMLGMIAIFGSLLTPDVLVWQTSSRRDRKAFGGGLHEGESKAGTLVATLVSLNAIIAASALHVADPSHMSTLTAAQALAPLGSFAPVVFSLGIIGSGLIALPILVASMCFSIAEAADWESGLSKPAWEARKFYILISAAMVLAVTIDFGRINTVAVLYWSQIVAGILTVPILLFLLLLGNDKSISPAKNTVGQNFLIGGAVGGMIMANLVFLWAEFLAKH